MELEPIQRLTKDIKNASIILNKDEARFLVDEYYIMQDGRIRNSAQIRSMSESEEPNLVLDWLAQQNHSLENQVKRALDAYSNSHPVGQWMRSNSGVGPVIAAGFLAHIDIEQAPTAGHIWSYAGLVPGVEWKKGEKRPWNANLKVLCWKLGESFVKVSGKENAVYGKLYAERKLLESAKNSNGEYQEQAALKLEKNKIGKTTDAYKSYSQGKLPPAHIHARAKRYAVKMFLSHLHHVWYVHHYDKLPPKPFAIEHLGHAHFVEIPNFNHIIR